MALSINSYWGDMLHIYNILFVIAAKFQTACGSDQGWPNTTLLLLISVRRLLRVFPCLGGGTGWLEWPPKRWTLAIVESSLLITQSLQITQHASMLSWEVYTVVVVVVFFTLTDRASTIPNNTRGCQSGTWSAGQKKIRGTSTKLL